MMRIALFVAPLLLLAVLVAVFALNIDRDPRRISSVMLDKPAPGFVLPAVAGLQKDGAAVPGFSRADLEGHATLVNVFASWCVPCRDEHPVLVALQQQGVRILGINQKDKPEQAIAFLNELGNPYAAVGADSNGRVSIDWGVYGVPESFVVDATGRIVLKHVGPISPDAAEKEILPALRAAAGQ